MLAPVHAPRAVDITTDQLRNELLNGTWAAGDRLPPERELAETLGINRQTLRTAIGRLQAEGLLVPRQGSGVVVQDWRSTAGIGLLPHLVAAGRFDLLGPFLAVRRAVAAECLAQACVLATDSEIHALDTLAQRLAVETDLEVLALGNLEFARVVLRLARNLPAELMFNTVAAVYACHPKLRQILLSNPDAVRASFPAIVQWLRMRQPEAARHAVNAVLQAMDDETMSQMEAT